jgi:hypothetical protein
MLSLITILTAISLPNVKAIGFSFNAPSSVEIDEEFTVSISTQEAVNEDFDIKIFVHKSKEYEIPRSTYISEIYNEEKDSWLDPWYYLKENFPDESEFDIRVTESPGRQMLCVRLRQSKNNEDGYFDEKCEEIDIEGSNNKNPEKEDDDETENEEDKKPDLVYYSNSYKIPEEPITQKTEEVEHIITLSAPKKPSKETIETPEFKSRNYIIYSFFGFLLLLVILLALKRL